MTKKRSNQGKEKKKERIQKLQHKLQKLMNDISAEVLADNSLPFINELSQVLENTKIQENYLLKVLENPKIQKNVINNSSQLITSNEKKLVKFSKKSFCFKNANQDIL
ncbi:hypothetical protein RhiirA5_433429 [Rhizophagus irregularis]|uniref:Uncharacterized protein n=1 Tax=Rhizophagus irregularis TaxID=588596 RepID=A0A2N0NRS3_9GLOM|nr:hypothetical protein RhiirA5_442535 [Rhizophagus irregularis]PKB97277.1 hypothetical protein RhiirA5_433429 [Rhizophagus irregularis]